MRCLTGLTRWATGLSLLVLALTACRASYVDRGAALYAEHDYVGAAEVFERCEAQLASASQRERARYGLYRGITLQSLGDPSRANYWLTVASEILERQPDALDATEQLTLSRAFESRAAWASRLGHGTQEETSGSAEVTAAR
jgi:hypothetical protein